MIEQFPEELPIISASIDTIKERLEELLRDAELRNSLGMRGREYAENYHNYEIIAFLLRDIYRGTYFGGTQREAFQKVKELKNNLGHSIY